MPPTSQPVAFAGALQLSSDPSLPADPIPFNFSGQFVALASGVLNITSPSTTPFPFDGVPAAGAKGILVRYDAQGAGALAAQIALNACTPPFELTPGSFFCYFNAAPGSGITAATITVTAACQIRFWILG
jgi:hypothetical protein